MRGLAIGLGLIAIGCILLVIGFCIAAELSPTQAGPLVGAYDGFGRKQTFKYFADLCKDTCRYTGASNWLYSDVGGCACTGLPFLGESTR